jgi:iron complex outermembrane receptor protein
MPYRELRPKTTLEAAPLFRPRTLAALLLSLSTAAASQAQTEPPKAEAAPAEAKAGPKPQAKPAAAPEPEDRDAELEGGFTATVRGEKSVLTDARAVGVLTRQDLKRNDGLFLDDTLNLIPGVRFESRTVAGGQRITIRGYGNSTNFNASGLKAYLNGIPLTDGEGSTALDDLDTSLLGRVEVIKGPASSLYGAGIGGVVRFSTLRAEPGETRATQEVTGGNPRVFRSNTRIENGTDTSSFTLNYGHQHSDGYRSHSLANKDFVLLTADYRPSSKQTVSVFGAFSHSFEQLAGQLTEQQLLDQVNYVEPPYLANNGHVAIDSLRFGLSHKYEWARWISNTTSLYGSGAQLNQPFAAGQTDNLSLNAGGRTEFSLRWQGEGFSVAATAGSELQQTSSFKKSYGLVNSVLGALRGDLQVAALTSNSFLQAEVALPAEFTVTAGASLNYTRYKIADRLTNSANPAHLDQSGIKSFDPIVTPRVALQKSFGEGLSVYAQLSQGYTPPASGATVIAAIGQVNKDLKPESGTLIELGSKGSLLGGKLGYEVALFDLRVTDKLTTQAIVDGNNKVLYTITTNAGAQDDKGLELSGRYTVLKDDAAALSLLQVFGAYAFSAFTYDGFKSDNNNNANTVSYDGKTVVGVPQHVFDVGVDAGSSTGLYANATFQYVGSINLTYDNTHTAKDYTLLNAKLGYRAELPYKFRVDAAIGGKNLLGSVYYTMAFLNQAYPTAASPNTPAPQVFLPGPGAQVYGAINLSRAF